MAKAKAAADVNLCKGCRLCVGGLSGSGDRTPEGDQQKGL